MSFVIKYIDESGKEKSVSLEADSSSEAIVASGINKARITDIHESQWQAVWQSLISPPPAILQQAMFLASLSSMVTSGQALHKSMKNLLDRYKKISKGDSTIKSSENVSDILKRYRFAPQAIVMAEVGEKAGELGEALRSCSTKIIEDIELKEGIGKGAQKGFLYIFFAVVSLIALPQSFAPMLIDYMNGGTLTLRPNFATHVIVFIYELTNHYWYLIAAAVGLIAFFRKPIWDVLKELPLFNAFHMLIQYKTSMLFLSSYSYLNSSGISTLAALNIIRKQSSRSDALIVTNLFNQVKRGQTLSKALDNDDFPYTVRTTLSGFEETTDEVKKKTMSSLMKVLNIEQIVLSKRISAVLITAGMAVLACTVLLIALGAVMPLMSLRQ